MNDLTASYIEDLENIATTESQKISLNNFKALGIPNTKMEDWLYTKLSDVLPQNFKKVQKLGSLQQVKLAGKYQLVTLNGSISLEDSHLPEGMKIEYTTLDHIDAIDDDQDTFAMLNASACEQVIRITLEKDYECDDIFSLVHLSDFEDEFSVPRVHITANKFSKCDFIEVFKGVDNKAYNVNAVTNFKVNPGANITYTKVQIEGNKAFHVGSLNAEVFKDASFKSFTFSTGAKKSRHNLTVRLKETGATCSVDGLYALNGDQHCDNFSHIAHIKEHTESSQLFKGVLDDNSRGVFTGKVLVCRDAQKVNSEQLNKNLLLTKKAHADTRPQLEVYADDVKCAHGATVGQMNEEEAFYLRSRGLSQSRVQKLLIHAFCSDAINKLDNDRIEKYLSDILFDSFEQRAFEHIEEENS